MREIHVNEITQTVARLCIEANYNLSEDILAALREAWQTEESALGRDVLEQILKNAVIAQSESIPICQDCGFPVVFVELGQDVHIGGGDLYQAIDDGVRRGYADGYLRRLGDHTPPVIHTKIVQGEAVKLSVMTKGAGSENMSALAMLTPADGTKGIIDFVVRTVDRAGANACPPIIVGLGIGGTAEKTMLLAKKALLRKVGEKNVDPRLAEIEDEILWRVNALGIGPQGFGGRTTALAVHLEAFATRISSLPVAVNIQCHASRHKEATL
ncbi:MAG: fumarate hydratase [Chloroflexi bacterium]|nr:fumarate hydratase [Chloroflexota bacterium]